ncbi:MAG: chromate efflux transporter [Actinobacteria bacterium]|nr:chromate efflux transporter [Actinomycetota bacterium]
MAAEPAEHDGRLRELAQLFGKLGVIAFGGPAAHIAMMHDEVVQRRRWISDQDFLDLIGVTNLIPGPNSTEMTMHVGRVRAGARGLLVAGASFILPAAAIVLACAVAYVRYGQTPSGQAVLYGIKPVVLAIIAQALLKLGRTALTRDALQWAVGGAALVAYLLGANEIAILLVGAVVVLTWRTARSSDGPLALVGVLLATASAPSLGLGRLFAVFAKIGAVLYGSGYVLLAFLRSDLVARLDVLTNQQLLDAVAIGQFTPGPLFTTATFIGYVLAGVPGAVVATVGIFLPAFCFVAAIGPFVERLRTRTWTAALLDGVNAAAVGLMAGVLVELAGDALVDALTAGVAALTGLLLWRTDLNSAWLVLGGAAIGVAATLAV